MKSLKFLLIAVVLGSTFMACNKYSKIEKSKDPVYKLNMADSLYNAGKYRIAQTLYEGLFPAYKGDKKFEDLYYKFAYTYYYLQQYQEAEGLFKGYLEVFPNSARAEEVDYMRAYSYFKQSPKIDLEQVNTIKAMNMMQTFINNHPGSPRIADATEIIDKSRAKLEMKDARTAQLYYDLGHFRAAAIAFESLLNTYPETTKGEEYKLMVVKSFYKFAGLSYASKQIERYSQVTTAYEDFLDRFPDSKVLAEAENYSNLSKIKIKELEYEQNSQTTKR